MSDAVKNQLLRSHLRAFGAPTPIGDTRHFWQDVCAEAADTIERLERELAETRADRDLHYSRCASLIFSEPFSKVTSAEIQKWHREYVADRDALAERCEKLREALIAAVECIKVWHVADDVWEIYYDHAPEMRLIRQALAAPKDAP